MNDDHRRMAEWDAAYVLGALNAADRHEFERHLEACPECRRAVSELTPAVGLLSRLSADDVAAIDGGPAASGRVDVVRSARLRARRTRMMWAAALAAAVLVIAAVAIPVTLSAVSHPTVTVALHDVGAVPLDASARLTDAAWGTSIDLDCRYPYSEVEAPAGGWTYSLAVVGADGAEQTVSTWRAWPGASARLSAATSLPVADIRALEIRNAAGVVLMRSDLPAHG